MDDRYLHRRGPRIIRAALLGLVATLLLVGVALAASFDVTAANSSATVNSAIFRQYTYPGSAGTGVIKAFLRTQNAGTQQGYNTDGAVQLDTVSGAGTKAITLNEVPQVVVGGVVYRQFILDLNESSVPINLTKLQIFTAASGTLVGYTGGASPNIGGATTLIWDLDSPTDNTVNMNRQLAGSGKTDYQLLVPNSLFGGGSVCNFNPTGSGCNVYVYFYNEFTNADSGFDEWSVGLNSPLPPTLEVIKDLIPANDTGVFDLQVGGVTYADDVGDNGRTFPVVVTPGTYAVRELAGTGTSLANYTSSIQCVDIDGAVVASAANAGPLNVAIVEGDNFTCTITNTRAGVTAITGTKTASPDIVAPGDQVTFTVRVNNAGAGSVNLTTLNDDIYGDIANPANPAIVSTTCDVTPPVVIAQGGFYQCAFVAVVSGAPNTNHTNTVTMTGVGPNNTSIATASEDVLILAPPGIEVIKTPDPAEVNAPGGPVVFTVRVDNTGGGDVTLSSLTDNVYGNITQVQGSVTATTCSVPQTILFGAFYECTFTANVTGTAGTTHTNTVTGSGTGFNGAAVSDGGSADVDIVPVPVAAISVTKTPDTPVAASGDAVTYTVEVKNTGATAVTIDSLSDDLFGDITQVQGNVTATDCATPAILNSGNTYTCHFTATVSGAVGGTHTNTVTACDTSPIPDVCGDDSADVDILAAPAITVAKSAGSSSVVSPGGPVVFTIRIDNTGGGDATIDSLTDDIYGDVTQVQGDVTATTCDVTPPVIIPEGSFYECAFTANVSGNPGDLHTNTATAAGEGFNGDPVSDSDSANVEIDGNPELTVTKSASPTQVAAPGGTVTFTVKVENTGDEPLENIGLTDSVYGNLLDAGNLSVSNNTCPAQAVSPLPAGSSFTCTFQAQVTGAAGDQHQNTAEGCGDSTTIGDNRVCDGDSATVDVITPSAICPAGTSANRRTDIIGKGMGSNTTVTAVGKVIVPNAGSVVSLYGQLAGKDQGPWKYARFIRPNGTYINDKTLESPAFRQWAVFWYGQDLTPANMAYWKARLIGAPTKKPYLQRAFILYPTYATTGQYVNVFETFADSNANHVHWETLYGFHPSQQLLVELPPPGQPVDLVVSVAVVDNDLDDRPFQLTISAGGVSQMVSLVGPSHGNLLNIVNVTLQGVPAGTDEIVLDLVSPEGIGDSVAVTGLTAHYACTR